MQNRKGGPEEALKILQNMDESMREKILNGIAKKDPSMAQFLRDNMVRFDDLIHLTPKMIQELLREISIDKLALALRGSDKNLMGHFSSNMSRNMAQDLLDVYNGPLQPMSRVNQAKSEIMEIVKKMMDQGKLVLNPDGKDEYV